MAVKEWMGVVSVLCSLVGYGLYMRSMFLGRTKPHVFSWIVWALLMVIVFLAQLIRDAGAGGWATGSSAACCLIIALWALARGERSVTRGDWVAFLGALAAIPVWAATHDALWVVILATCIDFLAYCPTFRKSWHKPEEENFGLYTVDILKWIAAFFAMSNYSAVTLIYPSFLVVSNMALVMVILARRSALRRRQGVAGVVAAALLVLAVGFGVFPARAESGDLPLYEVTDVAVDVTANSAAHARDQAIGEAQRDAFAQLLDRFDADAALGTKLSNDDLATLVQNFEVQNERASSIRYIGVFTVQFRPSAVRNYLASQGVAVAERRAMPLVIIPVAMNDGRPVLWEDSTRWRTAWGKSAHDDGVVPVIVPGGAADDVAVLGAADAVGGKAVAIQAFIAKYQAGGAAVAVLNGNLDNPAAGLTVDVTRYDAEGVAAPAVDHIALPTGTDRNAVDSILTQGVRLVRHQLETDWKQGQKLAAPPEGAGDATGYSGDPSVQAALTGPILHMPVEVRVATLSEWAQIRQKLGSTQGIVRVNVVALQRGAASIELELDASVPSVQQALTQKRLQLTQNPATNTWTLSPF